MPSSGMLRHVAPIRTDISDERITSVIRVTRIGELGTLLVTLIMEVIRSPESSDLTRATRPNIPEYVIFHSLRRENLRSYIALTGWAL
jgi:hypothetical protein